MVFLADNLDFSQVKPGHISTGHFHLLRWDPLPNWDQVKEGR